MLEYLNLLDDNFDSISKIIEQKLKNKICKNKLSRNDIKKVCLENYFY